MAKFSRGGMKVKIPFLFFFIRNYKCSYNKIYKYHGHILYNVEITFPQCHLHYHHGFSTFVWAAVCRSHRTLWRSTAGPVNNVLVTALKVTDPASNWGTAYGILTKNASQTPANLYRTGAFCSKELNFHSLPNTYIHHMHHFALLRCLKLVTDQNMMTVMEPECRRLIGRATNSTKSHI